MGETYGLARVRERSIGALILSAFGGLWLLIGFLAFRLLTRWTELMLGVLTIVLIAAACFLLKAVPQGLQPDPQRQQDRRKFAYVNVAQGVAIFLAFQLAYVFHHPDAAYDMTVLIVGLHMFALPRSYRIASNLITGGLLVLVSLVSPLLFRGDTMVGVVTLCAGLILWVSAVWKLRTAAVFLRSSHD